MLAWGFNPPPPFLVRVWLKCFGMATALLSSSPASPVSLGFRKLGWAGERFRGLSLTGPFPCSMQWPGDASQPSTPTRGSSWWATRQPMRTGTALEKTSQSWWRVPSEDRRRPSQRCPPFLGGTGHPLGLAQSGRGSDTSLVCPSPGRPMGSWRRGSWPCGYLKITQFPGTGSSCKSGGKVALPVCVSWGW